LASEHAAESVDLAEMNDGGFAARPP